MQITLVDSDTMALAFSYNATTVAFVKLLPNRKWDPVAKQWHVPVADFEAVIGTFLEATVHADVWAAAYPSRRVQLADALGYCRRLNQSGVRLFRDAKLTGKAKGTAYIRCEHDQADPDDLKVLERNVNERAAEILALMDAGHRFDIAARAQSVTPVTNTVTEVTTPRTPLREPTPLEQAFFNGIQNAKIIAERNEAMAARRKAKRFEVEQQAQLLKGIAR